MDKDALLKWLDEQIEQNTARLKVAMKLNNARLVARSRGYIDAYKNVKAHLEAESEKE
jgi:hypothetical protein